MIRRPVTARAWVTLAVIGVVAVVALGIWRATRDGGASETAAHATSTTTRTDVAGPTPSSSQPTTPSSSQPTTPTAADLAFRDPIRFDAIGDIGNGLTVRIAGIEAVQGEASLPGEIAGPALRIRVDVTNTSNRPISLEGTQVNVTYGVEGTPGMLLHAPGVTQFPPTVAPGAYVTATVVFGVPPAQRDQIQIAVATDAAAPVIVFEGAAA